MILRLSPLLNAAEFVTVFLLEALCRSGGDTSVLTLRIQSSHVPPPLLRACVSNKYHWHVSSFGASVPSSWWALGRHLNFSSSPSSLPSLCPCLSENCCQVLLPRPLSASVFKICGRNLHWSLSILSCKFVPPSCLWKLRSLWTLSVNRPMYMLSLLVLSLLTIRQTCFLYLLWNC